MFKQCPSCRGEYQEWVEACPDCRVPLVAGGAPLPPPEAPRALPPAAELVLIERGQPSELRVLAEALQAEGVSSRIDAVEPAGPRAAAFGLFVEREALATAVGVRNAHLESVVPDAAGLTGQVGAELAACPACEAPLAEQATECASCGLEFPDVVPEA